MTHWQYFYGLNNSIVHGNVRAILDSVIVALSLNPSRKFTCVPHTFPLHYIKPFPSITLNLSPSITLNLSPSLN